MKTKILKWLTLGFGILNLAVFIFHQHLPLNLFASGFCFFAYWQLSESEAALKEALKLPAASEIFYQDAFIKSLQKEKNDN